MVELGDEAECWRVAARARKRLEPDDGPAQKVAEAAAQQVETAVDEPSPHVRPRRHRHTIRSGRRRGEGLQRLSGKRNVCWTAINDAA